MTDYHLRLFSRDGARLIGEVAVQAPDNGPFPEAVRLGTVIYIYRPSTDGVLRYQEVTNYQLDDDALPLSDYELVRHGLAVIEPAPSVKHPVVFFNGKLMP